MNEILVKIEIFQETPFFHNTSALGNRGSLVTSPARPKFFPRIDNSHCETIHSCLTPVCCFDNGYVGKQQVALKEYSAEHWLKELQWVGALAAVIELKSS